MGSAEWNKNSEQRKKKQFTRKDIPKSQKFWFHIKQLRKAESVEQTIVNLTWIGLVYKNECFNEFYCFCWNWMNGCYRMFLRQKEKEISKIAVTGYLQLNAIWRIHLKVIFRIKNTIENCLKKKKCERRNGITNEKFIDRLISTRIKGHLLCQKKQHHHHQQKSLLKLNSSNDMWI